MSLMKSAQDLVLTRRWYYDSSAPEDTPILQAEFSVLVLIWVKSFLICVFPPLLQLQPQLGEDMIPDRPPPDFPGCYGKRFKYKGVLTRSWYVSSRFWQREAAQHVGIAVVLSGFILDGVIIGSQDESPLLDLG